MRKVEEESADDDGSNFGGNFWKWFLSIIDQGLPILNTLVLSIVGGRRAHARIRRRRNLQRPPAVPAPAPASPPVPVVANLMTWISHNLFWHFKCHFNIFGVFFKTPLNRSKDNLFKNYLIFNKHPFPSLAGPQWTTMLLVVNPLHFYWMLVHFRSAGYKKVVMWKIFSFKPCQERRTMIKVILKIQFQVW